MTYGYHLPYGEPGYGQPDGVIYELLLGGKCASAQHNLDTDWSDLGVGGPREVLMMQVAIEMCRNNKARARYFFERAQSRYGWGGLGLPQDGFSCDIYRAITGFWNKSPVHTCPGRKGRIPLWPGGGYFPSRPVRACEDPRYGTGTCPGPAPPVTPTTSAPSSPSTPLPSGSPTPEASISTSPASASTMP